MNSRRLLFPALCFGSLLIVLAVGFLLWPSSAPAPPETSEAVRPPVPLQARGEGSSAEGETEKALNPASFDWAEIDHRAPDSATEADGRKTVARMEETVDEALRRFAENPKAARAWALEQGQMARPAMRAILDAWVEEDPEAAFESARWIVVREDPNARAYGLSLVVEAWASFDPEAAAKAVQTLPASLNADLLRNQVFGHWAAQDPAAAAAALQAQPATGGTISQSTFANVASLLALQDNVRAKQWAMRFPDGSPERAYAISGVISGWIEQDPNGPVDWLEQMEPGASRDAGATTLVQWAIPIDPEGAVKWAQTISDDTKRSELTAFAAATWLVADPAKAGTWIRESNALTEKQRATILESNRQIRNITGTAP